MEVLGRRATLPDVARAMKKFMTAPEAAPLLRKAYMEPLAH